VLNELPFQSLRDRMLLLRSLSGFAPLEDEALSLFAEHMRLRRCRQGQVLLVLGEPIHHVFVVLEGRVRWRRKDRPERVAEHSEVVGWITLMARDPDGLDAVADSDALVIELPAEVLEQALEEDFAIVRNSMRLGAGALLAARGHLPARPSEAPRVELGVLRSEPLSLVERVIEMRRAPLFARANAEALIALVRSGRDFRAEAGELLWGVGDTAPFWVILDYGCVRCTSRTGEQVDVGANFVLGIMDAIAQEPRSFEARTATSIVGRRIDLESFLGVLEIHFDLARDFVAFVSNAVLEVNAHRMPAAVIEPVEGTPGDRPPDDTA
jgi:CRP-like cAMP-binding protein